MLTVRAILDSAISRLAAAGVESARLDAELLLAHVLGKNRGWVWAHPEVTISTEDAARFGALLARRERREPLAYLLGSWEFYGHDFEVSPAVLVPRPETELLVEAIVKWAKPLPAPRVADIGTGSGAIAVSLALELPAATVLAVDQSAEALAVARRNAARHGVTDRLTFLHGDLLAPVRALGTPLLDAIAANLPYISEEDYPHLMPEVRDFEPEMALRAADGGLAVIRRLIAQAPDVLRSGGLLGLEVGLEQAEMVAADLRDAGWDDIRVIDDYAGIPRHVLAVRVAGKP